MTAIQAVPIGDSYTPRAAFPVAPRQIQGWRTGHPVFPHGLYSSLLPEKFPCSDDSPEVECSHGSSFEGEWLVMTGQVRDADREPVGLIPWRGDPQFAAGNRHGASWSLDLQMPRLIDAQQLAGQGLLAVIQCDSLAPPTEGLVVGVQQT